MNRPHKMPYHHRPIERRVLTVVLHILILGTSRGLAGQVGDNSGHDPVSDFRQYIAQFRQLNRVHFVANVEISLHSRQRASTAPAALSVAAVGTYEFRADGNKWRVAVDEARNSVSRPIKTTASFDGKKCYILLGGERKLEVGRDIRPSPVDCLNNPILASLDFLHPCDDAITFGLLSLDDIRDADLSVLNNARWIAGNVSGDLGYLLISTGRTRGGQPQTFRVSFQSPGAVDQRLPKEVDEYSGAKLWARTSIASYVRIHDSRLGDFYLPQGVTQQGYDGPTLLSATVWTFGNYDLPDRPDPNLFAIDYHVAETVFDDDIGIFVRQAGGYRAVDSAIAEAQNSPNADADLGHSLDRRHTGAPVIARIAYIGGFTFGAGCLVMVGILIMKRRTGRRI